MKKKVQSDRTQNPPEKPSGLFIALLIAIILVSAAILAMIVYGLLRDHVWEKNATENAVQTATVSTPEPTLEPTPEPTPTPRPEPIEYYRDILDRYYDAAAQQLDIEALNNAGLCYMAAYGYGGDGLQHIGYILTDLDGDGVTELLIGCSTGDAYTDEIVLEMYTIRDDEVKQIFSSGERDRYYLCSDGTIANEVSSSAYESSFRYFTYALQELKLREEIGFNMTENRNDPWFRISEDGTKTVISEEEATAATQTVRDTYLSIAYTPFAQYK